MWIIVTPANTKLVVRVNSDHIIAYTDHDGHDHTLLYLSPITGLSNPMIVEETPRQIDEQLAAFDPK